MDKMSQQEKQTLESIEIFKPAVGKVVEGEVVEINDEENCILINLNTQTEGRIYIEHFCSDFENKKFSKLVKVGDVVRAKITKWDEEHSILLLSRLPLLKEENLLKIKEQFEKGDTIIANVKQANEGGLVLEYLGHEIFVPNSLLDFEINNNKNEYLNKKLELVISDVQERFRGQTKILGSRKPIYEKVRQELLEERNKQREENLNKINAGDVLTGEVVKIEEHAATVKVSEYVTGLLRISQVSHHHVEVIGDVLKVGQKVQVKILKKEGNRLDLSMKALLPTIFEEYIASHKVGDTVTGKIVQKLPIGLIVEVDKGVKGLLHKSEFSWRLNDNLDLLTKIGDEIELKILALDPKKERVSLSRKALMENPWKNVTVRRNDIVKAIVTEITQEGLKVEVQGVEGFIPVQEIVLTKGILEDYYAVKDEVEAIVLKADKKTWEMVLSIKKVNERAQQKELKEILKNQEEETTVTIGDLLDGMELKK